MDFNILKADFIQYLANNHDGSQINAPSNNAEGSIFDENNNDFENLSGVSLLYEYKDEFSEYLKSEYNFDWSDSMGSLKDLLDYELYNGEISTLMIYRSKKEEKLRKIKRRKLLKNSKMQTLLQMKVKLL